MGSNRNSLVMGLRLLLDFVVKLEEVKLFYWQDSEFIFRKFFYKTKAFENLIFKRFIVGVSVGFFLFTRCLFYSK